MSARFNRRIVRELGTLESAGLLDPRQARAIAERYPITPWDVVILARVFTVVGAIAAGAGAVILAKEMIDALKLIEVGLLLAFGALLLAGRWLTRTRQMPRTGAAMELAAGFALQGLTTALAIDFSTGSKNWPALVGVQTVLLVGLAYLLNNRLVLAHACATAFVWFGGETGYESGWGMYWLGMTYPVRFLAAGIIVLGVAWLHAERIPRYQAFSRVYGHAGALDLHLALWFLSVFGMYNGADSFRWDNDGERLLFTMVWAAVAGGFIFAGARLAIGLLRSYGLVFLIINIYTFYFQFVVVHSAEAWWLHLLLAGGSLVAVGFWLEKQLRHSASIS